MKNVFLKIFITSALACALGNSATAATVFTLTEDACTGTCGTSPYGTVTLNQINSNTVNVTVDLTSSEGFAGTGAGEALEFNLSAPSFTIGDLSAGFAVGPAPAHASAFGTFLQSIECLLCQGGNANNLGGPLSFNVNSASGIQISDFLANSKGYFFASDIVGTNANTGNVAAVGSQSAVPEPGTTMLLSAGLAVIGLLRRR
jgi:hypothetical protein